MAALMNPVFAFLLLTSIVHGGSLHRRDDVAATRDAMTTPSPVERLVEDIVEDIVITEQKDERVVADENSDSLDNGADSNVNAALPASSAPVLEQIVIRTHEDEEVFPGREGEIREEVSSNKVFGEPLGGEHYVLVSVDELMELAESGLVYRPKFRYSRKQRRRFGRSTSRRTSV